MWSLRRQPRPGRILGDLGAAKQFEWTEELTHRLINCGYTEMLPPLVTTNLPITDLRSVVGDRVAPAWQR
ncbi:hypothetical protein [Streptomyces virginiae]|uniref:hypothetical protein n=1 Tax=Streptomyces virginiae TaxID=1961 RepID=UPI0035DC5932